MREDWGKWLWNSEVFKVVDSAFDEDKWNGDKEEEDGEREKTGTV